MMPDDQPDNFVMPFGKYRGRRMIDVRFNDPGYLIWLAQRDPVITGGRFLAAVAAAKGVLAHFPDLLRPGRYFPRPAVFDPSFQQDLHDEIALREGRLA
jgi:uncharacterized protein (DUF3820 family)